MPHEEGIFEAEAIGRVYTISLRQGECYYLWLLLHEVCGATSFDDLKIIAGDICSTFWEACHRWGLLENDNQYSLALEEAVMSQIPSQVRTLYAIILTTYIQCRMEVQKPACTIWAQWSSCTLGHSPCSTTEDFWHHHCVSLSESDLTFTDDMYNQVLNDIQEKLFTIRWTRAFHTWTTCSSARCSWKTSPWIPSRNQLYIYDVGEQAFISSTNKNIWQPISAQSFISSWLLWMQTKVSWYISHHRLEILYLWFLPLLYRWSFLPWYARRNWEDVFDYHCAGSNSITETNCSCHSVKWHCCNTTVWWLYTTFQVKIPLDAHSQELPMCSIKKGIVFAKGIIDCKAISVDEALMTHRCAFEAVDWTLRDIRSIDAPFGGILTLLCGNFRQILSVVRNGTRANIVDACLKHSYLFVEAWVAR